jgi:hypothetical protein
LAREAVLAEGGLQGRRRVRERTRFDPAGALEETQGRRNSRGRGVGVLVLSGEVLEEEGLVESSSLWVLASIRAEG